MTETCACATLMTLDDMVSTGRVGPPVRSALIGRYIANTEL